MIGTWDAVGMAGVPGLAIVGDRASLGGWHAASGPLRLATGMPRRVAARDPGGEVLPRQTPAGSLAMRHIHG